MENKFYSPTDLIQLSDDLKKIDRNTYIIAGGTDLSIKFQQNNIMKYNILDLSKIEVLNNIKETDDYIEIGSTVTMTELAESKLIKDKLSALADAAGNVGSTQIRNRATIGGNLANAAQCADTIPVLYSYDAKIQTINSKGAIKNRDVIGLVEGIGKTKLEEDEVIVKILIKKDNYTSAFRKVGSRKTVTISKLNISGNFKFEDNKIRSVRIYMGAVGIKPTRAELLEEYLDGKSIKDIDKNIFDIAEQEVLKAIPDRSSRYYKKIAIKGLVDDLIKDISRRLEKHE